MVECKSGEFSFIYQEISSNFREDINLVDIIRTEADKGDIYDTEHFVFTENWVF